MILQKIRQLKLNMGIHGSRALGFLGLSLSCHPLQLGLQCSHVLGMLSLLGLGIGRRLLHLPLQSPQALGLLRLPRSGAGGRLLQLLCERRHALSVLRLAGLHTHGREQWEAVEQADQACSPNQIPSQLSPSEQFQSCEWQKISLAWHCWGVL
jgi:hypothetical protein